MYQKILFCYDGTAEGRSALAQGARVAVALHAQAYLLAICRNVVATPIPEGIAPELVTAEQATARALLDDGVQRLREMGLQAEGSLVFGDPLVHIPQTAKRIGADLVVLGHRQRGRFARWWSQSQEEWLMDRLSCSVLVAVAPPG
ncbi:MAG: universal stress protein [Steroidobacteraceae bacterium]